MRSTLPKRLVDLSSHAQSVTATIEPNIGIGTTKKSLPYPILQKKLVSCLVEQWHCRNIANVYHVNFNNCHFLAVHIKSKQYNSSFCSSLLHVIRMSHGLCTLELDMTLLQKYSNVESPPTVSYYVFRTCHGITAKTDLKRYLGTVIHHSILEAAYQ